MRSSSAASSSTPRRRWSCGPTRAASTPIASSAGSRPTTRGRPGPRRPPRRLQRLRAGHQPLRPADSGPDPGAGRAGPRRWLGPALAPAGRRPVRDPFRRLRDQPALFRGPPGQARAERPFPARPRRHDLPDPRCQGSRLARDHRQRSLDRHRDRQHRRLSRSTPRTRSAQWYQPDAEGHVRLVIPGDVQGRRPDRLGQPPPADSERAGHGPHPGPGAPSSTT